MTVKQREQNLRNGHFNKQRPKKRSCDQNDLQNQPRSILLRINAISNRSLLWM